MSKNNVKFIPHRLKRRILLSITLITPVVILVCLIAAASIAYDSRVRSNLLRSKDALLQQRANLERQQRTIQYYLRDVDRSLRDVEYALSRTN